MTQPALMSLISVLLCFQTKINIAEMESFQRHSAEVEGENSIEQRDLAVLAYAV